MKKLIPIVLMAISICTLFGCNKSENSINTEVYETQKIETNKKLQKEYELPVDYESTLWLGATEKNHINVLCIYSQNNYIPYQYFANTNF